MDHDQVEQIFLHALHLHGADRDAYLVEACEGDDELSAQVRSLITAHEAVGRFMADEPTVAAAVDADGANALLGRCIGQFTIRRIIGRGGMGIVYEAVQDKPQRIVALKVMQPDKVSPQTLRRFAHEADILARFQHPNIAQVHDAGTHRDGEHDLPYFAMELIPNARTLTEYARHKGLDINARLVMFRQVCEAVHHAHHRGIIHRDLKPGNILVDTQGVPKVIDFGVARRAGADLTTMQTGLGQLIGTLQYMSPEQCEGDVDAIDMRSDVYSLGVLLYELLCDALPYNVRRAALHEAARVIREEMPPRPSSYNKLLKGDIEVVALKALEKERGRRYQTAADFAADIERYLRREPIIARPPSLGRLLVRAVSQRWRPIAAFVGMAITALLVLWLTRPDPRVPLTVTAYDGPSEAIVTGASVSVRPITYTTRDLGDPIVLGKTPLEDVPLDPGGYRVMVRHTDGRFAETVVDLREGTDGEAMRLALRSAADATRGMIRIPSARARVGHHKPIRFYEQRTVRLPAFWIDAYEVTNAEYRLFVEATGHRPPETWIDGYPESLADHPVTGVAWASARAYAAWVGKRLPSDIEWERAARGTDGRINVWGPDDSPENAMVVGHERPGLADGITSETVASYAAGTVPATVMPDGMRDRTVDGVLHMGGNVREWTETLPSLELGDLGLVTQYGFRITKGFHWASPTTDGYHLANFSFCPETSPGVVTGFRCVRSDLP